MQNSNPETPQLTRTERRRQLTRTALVDAVRKLTAEKGVDAVTISEIAEEADVGKGSFYNYFDSKEELLKEAVQSTVFQSGEVIDLMNASADDPLDIIATAFATFDQMLRDDPLLGWFIVRISAHDPSIIDTLAQRFSRDVKSGIEAGAFNVPDVEIATRAVKAALLDFFRHRLLSDVDDEGVIHFIHLMLRMLGADEESAKSAAHAATSKNVQSQMEK